MNETAHEILTLHVLPLRVGVGKPTLTAGLSDHGHSWSFIAPQVFLGQ